MKLGRRNEVPVELTWDLRLIYPTEAELLADAAKMKALCDQMVKTYPHTLNHPATINACLDDVQEWTRLAMLTTCYTDLAVSVDYYDNHAQELNGKMLAAYTEQQSTLSFVESELLEQPAEVLEAAMNQSAGNRGYLQKLLAQKPYRLSPETEKTLAALGQTFQAPYQIYNMQKLADITFDSFTVNGEEFPLGYSLFEDNYEYDNRTDVRRAAFRAFSDTIKRYENGTAAVYYAQCRTEKTLSDLRGFPSVFDSLLLNQRVTPDLYHRQIDLIMEKLAPHMRKYAALIKRLHHLDRMTYADLKLPLDAEYDPKVTVEESKRYVRDGLAVLGDDYVAMIDEAYRDRWVDFAKNQGKATGGFCASPYGKGSFILMSWNDRMADVFTLAHELGHAGHFKACNAAQTILDTEVSSYFVEAPSTMNELLMAHYLLKTKPEKRFRRWVLSCIISNTYYHNFVTHLLEAAYQREVYRIIDAGGSVQADTLNRLMKETLQEFWGDTVELTEGAELTWMRQPHYYMGLYSYTYSAGLTVATQVCKRIETEGQPAVDDWKQVLKAGGTLDPMGLAKLAKVDISTDEPLLDTIETIGGMIDEICRLTDEIEAES